MFRITRTYNNKIWRAYF